MGIKISYAVTVCNEFVEIQRLIAFLLKNKRSQDEIVVLFDEANGDKEIKTYLSSHSVTGKFMWYAGKFERHFADWKNKLTSLCSGDYIFFLDADELPHEDLIQTFPEILEMNPEMDIFLVPRINTVDGITSEHIANWGWNITKLDSVIGEKILDLSNPKDLKEYEFLKECDLIIEENTFSKKVKYYKPIINWPDYQSRICKNTPEIKWVNKVHERLDGFKTYTMLPDVEYFALYHPKTIDKQEKQNKFYDTL